MAKLRKSKAAASRERVSTVTEAPKASAPVSEAAREVVMVPPAPRGVRRLGGRVA
jgi:hypothetical protein